MEKITPNLASDRASDCLNLNNPREPLSKVLLQTAPSQYIRYDSVDAIRFYPNKLTSFAYQT